MRRRDLIKGIAGSAAAWPLAARAQEPGRNYRFGFLTPTARGSPPVAAFFDELRRNGFVEGQNLTVLGEGFAYSNDQIERIAASLVAASPDAITAGPELPLRALQKLTRTIPIIGMTEDMVGEGFAASLARPGGNITGLSLLTPELDGKRQEILVDALPGLRKIAVMADSNSDTPAHLAQLQKAGESRGLEVILRTVAKRDDVIAAIRDVKTAGVQAINFLATPMFSINAGAFIAEVTNLRLASIYQWPEDAEAGALLSYGPRITNMYRIRGSIAAKVLRGTAPADIPIEQPTKFELVVNLKTAKAIGIEVENSLLLRADKVIE
jgi:putative tryptophan/tyrosine transport system substrate-binding protein